MRRACSSTLKKSAHILGMQLVKHYRFARAQYDDLRARGKRAAGAFRRIVRSFSRVLHALIRDGKTFDEDLYIASVKRRGVTQAQALWRRTFSDHRLQTQ
jgi:pyrimidine operon attenuation protein/uracil phosphoribosyltransferase